MGGTSIVLPHSGPFIYHLEAMRTHLARAAVAEAGSAPSHHGLPHRYQEMDRETPEGLTLCWLEPGSGWGEKLGGQGAPGQGLHGSILSSGPTRGALLLLCCMGTLLSVYTASISGRNDLRRIIIELKASSKRLLEKCVSALQISFLSHFFKTPFLAPRRRGSFQT